MAGSWDTVQTLTSWLDSKRSCWEISHKARLSDEMIPEFNVFTPVKLDTKSEAWPTAGSYFSPLAMHLNLPVNSKNRGAQPASPPRRCSSSGWGSSVAFQALQGILTLSQRWQPVSGHLMHIFNIWKMNDQVLLKERGSALLKPFGTLLGIKSKSKKGIGGNVEWCTAKCAGKPDVL